ncbi:MAG: hypothetical protein RLZZ568_35 [Cyanobacteriota bacterium]|jgi:hypothetical protein
MVTSTPFNQAFMFFPPPNGSSDNNNVDAKNIEEDYLDIEAPRRRLALKRARNWFVLLVAAGLTLGVVVAFGVVQVLNRLGLTAKPDAPLQIELSRPEQPESRF